MRELRLGSTALHIKANAADLLTKPVDTVTHRSLTSPLLFQKPHLPNQGEYQNTFLRHNLKADWYGYKGGVQKDIKRENKGANQSHSHVKTVRGLRGPTAMEGGFGSGFTMVITFTF